MQKLARIIDFTQVFYKAAQTPAARNLGDVDAPGFAQVKPKPTTPKTKSIQPVQPRNLGNVDAPGFAKGTLPITQVSTTLPVSTTQETRDLGSLDPPSEYNRPVLKPNVAIANALKAHPVKGLRGGTLRVEGFKIIFTLPRGVDALSSADMTTINSIINSLPLYGYTVVYEKYGKVPKPVLQPKDPENITSNDIIVNIPEALLKKLSQVKITGNVINFITKAPITDNDRQLLDGIVNEMSREYSTAYFTP